MLTCIFFVAVTSCGPEVKNCPAKLGEVTTEIIALSTTVCPVTQSSITPVAPVAGAPKDVPSYQYSAASSTAAMGISPSAPLVVASPSSRLVSVISSSSHSPSPISLSYYFLLLLIKVLWLIL